MKNTPIQILAKVISDTDKNFVITIPKTNTTIRSREKCEIIKFLNNVNCTTAIFIRHFGNDYPEYYIPAIDSPGKRFNILGGILLTPQEVGTYHSLTSEECFMSAQQLITKGIYIANLAEITAWDFDKILEKLKTKSMLQQMRL